MKLAIISHTEHYKNAEGSIVGWGPTITEINHLSQDFEEIYHLAFFFEENAPPSSLPYTSSNIHFVPLPPSGGKSLKAKLGILKRLPQTLNIINEVLKEVDVFQFRAPVGMGVYLIPWLTFFYSKKGWYKYAGNWDQKDAPLGFALQRWMLKKQHRKVTVNGKWPNQERQCITFENPCLTEGERIEGKDLIGTKNFSTGKVFCFVGRLEDQKGVQLIIDAFSELKKTGDLNKIHFIGNGKKLEEYKRDAAENKLPVEFHGFKNREEVFQIYKRSHFLLLPSSASEGFPKVIAEAMNYGCIPVVSDISSIGQYILKGRNGFITKPLTASGLLKNLKDCLALNEKEYKEMIKFNHQVPSDFTFTRYRLRIQQEILDK